MKTIFLTLILFLFNLFQPYCEQFVPSMVFKKYSDLQSIGENELLEIKSYVGSVAYYNSPFGWSLGNVSDSNGYMSPKYLITPLKFRNFTIFMVEKNYQPGKYVCYDFVVHNHPDSVLYTSETLESSKESENFYSKGFPFYRVEGLYEYPINAPHTSQPPSGEVLYPQYVFKCDSQSGIFEIVENNEKEYTLENGLKRTWGWWYGHVNDYGVRVRNSPSLKGDILKTVDKNVEVQVRERSAEPETIDGESWYWYKIHGDMIEGWIYGKYLERINSYL